MLGKKVQVLLPALVLGMVLAGLSGCGSKASSSTGTNNAPGGQPDHAKIEIDLPVSTQGKAVVTLGVVAMVQRLYTTIFALPPLLPDQPCTMEYGPHYTLTFLQGEKTLTTVVAKRQGCRPISVAGEKQDRQGSADFWSQLDQAIYQATPVARPTWLAIMHTSQGGQPPQTTRITSSEQVQHLYNALLALPLASPAMSCVTEQWPAYQMVFHTVDQVIPSVISMNCNTISLEGMDRTRGGTYLMNDQFKQLFTQTLAEVKFASARPDQLVFTLQLGSGTFTRGLIADAQLRQQLYTKVFALHLGLSQPSCSAEADKVAGTGKWYTFSFTQWDLPVLGIDAFEGHCKLVSLSVSGQVLLGDAEFWNLAHRAASS